MEINDNEITVTCRLCGEQVKRVYGKHLKFKHDNITTKEYKEMFPEAPIMAKSDLKNTSKNSGQHMKQEKYKKMFSEMFKGENNPMHHTKTTQEFRKKQSPFSREFYKERFPNISEKEIDKKIKEVTNKVVADRLLPSNRDYWIKKGFSKSEAEKKVSESQTTFSKEICIEKYGEEEGLKLWSDRQERWQKTLKSKPEEEIIKINMKKLFNGNGYSNISNEMFDKIYEQLSDELKISSFYTNNNNEIIRYDKHNKRYYRLDFFNSKLNKCIEFHGDFWHCNPDKYNADHKHRITNKTASEIWEYDITKKEFIENEMGCEYLTIWESEYKKDKKSTIKKCIDFLNETNN